ncbi:MAG: hypothetical protein LUE10_09690 [Alistipes sp.]|nr:hypothetical protein [Alistipes sp.]
MKNIRYAVLLTLLSFTLSCATVGLGSRVQKTSVGMTKTQVVKTLGNQYQVVHSQMTGEGATVEILLFSDIYGVYYEYEFIDDTLVRFTKIKELPEQGHKPGHRH